MLILVNTVYYLRVIKKENIILVNVYFVLREGNKKQMVRLKTNTESKLRLIHQMSYTSTRYRRKQTSYLSSSIYNHNLDSPVNQSLRRSYMSSLPQVYQNLSTTRIVFCSLRGQDNRSLGF